MPILLLIRHAVTEVTGTHLPLPETPLSERGHAQALALAERLRQVPLRALYSSPLPRCRATAEAVAAGRRLTVQVEEDLQDIRYGRWAGRPLAQLRRSALWPLVQHHPTAVRFPEGESLSDVLRRGVASIEAIAGRHRRGLVGVVSHADVIRLAVGHFAGAHPDLFQRLVVAPASVSVVALGDGTPRVLRVNDTGSFDDLIPRRRGRASAPDRLKGKGRRPSPRS